MKKSSTSTLNKRILAMLLAVAGISALPFALYREYDLELRIDEGLLGNYGDFIGGLLSVVSIYLLVETLKEERATSKEQRDFTEKQQALIEKQQKNADEQQINSLFFHLLKHLQREVADLNITTEDGQYTNKDFFEVLRRDLQESFNATDTYTKAVARALPHYFKLYAEHPRLGSYFRILYRICEVIDHSKLDGTEKVKYIKILRAQLTNSELLLLRYNAQTPHGRKFKHYINEYNLLKHLPIFELLEFKHWWGDLKDKPVDRLRISVFCDELKHEIKKLLEDSKQRGDLRGGGWKCRIIRHSDISLEIKIDKPTSPGRHHLFETFGKEEQEELLESILLDIFSYSNFGRKRKGKDLEIESRSEDAIICSSVKAKDGRPLYRSFQRLSEL